MPSHDIAMVDTVGPQSDPNTSKREQEDDIENKYLDEKAGYGGAEVSPVDALDKHLAETQDMEQRIQDGTATDDEYRIENNHDVAVRVLSTYDDPTLPAVTFRSLFLGLGFACFGSVLAQLYYFKPQTLAVSQSFLLIITYFLGKFMEKVIPSRGIFRYLNPGPFNIKEHAAAIICCSTAASSAIAIQVISVQDLYYNNTMNPGTAIFTLLSSQLIGYGMAGLLQKVTVYPSMALWPSKISVANTFQALHFDGGLSTKRLRFFWIVFAAAFVYEILPQWIFPLLGAVSIICMAQHTNEVVRNVFGGGSNNEGMGLFEWCFDWNYIGSSCLYTPLWTQLNIDIGIILTYILMSAVYYGNLWKGLSFPFMSQAIFAADGTEYNQTLILTDNQLDRAKYAEVGQAYFSSTNALFLVVDNLSIGAALVQVFLWNWKDIAPIVSGMSFRRDKSKPGMFAGGFKGFLYSFGRAEWPTGIDDEHYLVMTKSYRPIPQAWFVGILAGAFAIAMATNYAGDSGMPWWGLILTLVLAFIFTVVYTFLGAVLGFGQFSSGGTGLYSLLGGYLVPGKPVANMYFAMYGNNPQVQANFLLEDLKLGQYLKIPPRVTFLMQLLGTVVGAILNYVMMKSIISAQRPALLSISGTRLWSGQNAQSYNSNAIAWGALGPEMFGAGKTYASVPAALGYGCLLPIPFYLVHRFIFPKWTILTKINPAIITQYSCYMSVGVNSSVIPSMVIGIFSQGFVRTRYPRAFTKYNYLFAGAMDGGTQVISFILNFAVFGAAGGATAFPIWWGNPDGDLLSTDRCLVPPS